MPQYPVPEHMAFPVHLLVPVHRGVRVLEIVDRSGTEQMKMLQKCHSVLDHLQYLYIQNNLQYLYIQNLQYLYIQKKRA
jgi:hypothetical protein